MTGVENLSVIRCRRMDDNDENMFCVSVFNPYSTERTQFSNSRMTYLHQVVAVTFIVED